MHKLCKELEEGSPNMEGAAGQFFPTRVAFSYQPAGRFEQA